MLFRTLSENEFAAIVAGTKKIVLAAVRRNLDAQFVDSVDDVVQETYLRAFRALSRGKFRGESALSSYLYAIARNEALRMNRKRNRESQRLSYRAEVARDVADERAGTDHVAERHLESQRLEELLERLPATYRDVLKLYGAGQSQQEIAAALGISIGTVKSRTSRGLELLRKIWRETPGA